MCGDEIYNKYSEKPVEAGSEFKFMYNYRLAGF